ncbi:MAG: hypothetical protein NWE93_07195 [Candidatus Bathyarchaeota archaeon]|nr:hypothetical protein [Candidatus Bathyarchaeota archaeon]
MALNRACSFFLIALLLCGVALSCLGAVNAQASIPKPSVPQFTVTFDGPSFTLNTTYHLDQNTGEVVADIGYTNQYSYLVLTIKNQQFDSSHGELYYQIQIKNQNTGHQWQNVTYDGPNPKQTTNSEVTELTLSIQGQWGVPNLAGTQTEIQVRAMLGDFYYGHVYVFGGWMFSGETSDWSSTQSVSVPANVPLGSTSTPSSMSTPTPIPANSVVVSPSPTATVAQSATASDAPLLNWIEPVAFAVLVAVVALLVVFLVLMQRRIRVLEAKQSGAE